MSERREEGKGPKEIRLNVESDDTIETIAEKLVKSWEPNSYTIVEFDGIELDAGGGTTQDEIIERYNKAKSK